MRLNRMSFALIAVALPALAGCSLLGGPTIEALQVEVGECIADPAVSEQGSQEVGELPVVNCDEPHYGEVYYAEDLSTDTMPDDVSDQAEDICYARFESFVGVPWEDSEYYFTAMTPTPGSWELGDRQIACVMVGGVSEAITGTLAGAEA